MSAGRGSGRGSGPGSGPGGGPGSRDAALSPTLAFGRFTIDFAAEQVRCDGRPLDVRPKTYAVLAHLARHAGQLVTKEDLLRTVWGDVHVGGAVVKDSVLELRRLLGDDPKHPVFIETVHRRGYRFVAPVRMALTADPADESARAPVGRDAELARLCELAARALSGRRQVAFVTGEPGIGKTTLIEAMRRALAPQGFAWAVGQCVEQFGAGEAYLPVVQALTALCLGDDGERVRDTLRRHAPSWVHQMPGVIAPAHAPPSSATHGRMLREISAAVDALAIDRPLAIVLEDLHWSDDSTLELVSVLARGQTAGRLLIVGSYRRADVLANGHALRAVRQELGLHGHCDEIRLPFLGPADVARYLARRFRASDEAALAAVADAIHRRTEGNPLFMVSVVDGLVAAGAVAHDGTAWLLPAADVVGRQLPDNVEQLIDRQFDRLSKPDREVLVAASAVGVECGAASVAAATGGDVGAVEARCDALVRRERFLRRAGVDRWPDGTVAARYAFVHDVYRDVIAARASVRRAAELHRRIGERIEQGYGHRAHEVAAELAEHWERADDPARALRHHKQAAENALARHAVPEAVAQWTRALAALGRLPAGRRRDEEELQLELTRGLHHLAARGEADPDARTALGRAQALSERLDDRGRLPSALLMQWGTAFVRGDVRRAENLARRLLAVAEGARSPDGEVRGRLALGLALSYTGALAEAREQLESVVAMTSEGADAGPLAAFDVAGMFDPRVAARVYLAVVQCLAGLPDRALATVAEARAIADRLAHGYHRTMCLTFLTMVRAMRGEPAEAHAAATAQLRQASADGFAAWEAIGHIYRGCATIMTGDRDAGLAEMRSGLAAWEQGGGGLGAGSLYCHVAQGLLAAGDVAGADAMVARALEVGDELGERSLEPELLRLRAECLRRPSEGRVPDPAAASTCLRAAFETARARGALMSELDCALALADADPEADCGALASVVARCTEGFGTPRYLAAQQLLARR